MYHGSRFLISEGFIMPHPSPVVENKEVVFGTPDVRFALQYCGKKWSDKDFESGVIDDKFFMIEKKPGIFNKIYLGQKGYLYKISPKGFSTDPRLGSSERISRYPARIIEISVVPDAAEALVKSGVKVVKYQDLAIITFKKGKGKVLENLETIIKIKKNATIDSEYINWKELNRMMFGNPESKKYKKIGISKNFLIDGYPVFTTW